MTGTTATRIDRRTFLARTAALGGAVAMTGWDIAPARAQSDRLRPAVPWGVQAGDAGEGSAVVWSATDRPARMIVEYATSERFADGRRAAPVAALPETGYAAKVVLTGLPAGESVFYRVSFQDLGDLRSTSAPVTGRFRTAPADRRDITFVWSGDTAGQGWGSSPDWGGMKIYEVMRRRHDLRRQPHSAPGRAAPRCRHVAERRQPSRGRR